MVLHRRQLARPTASESNSGPSKPLILAHGFTQNSECWGRFGELLTDRADVTFVDAPGHGRSAHDNANLWVAAELLTEAGGPGIYVGYSMGGRMALHAALATPDMVEGLVLIGATAGLDEEADRAARRAADAQLAARLVMDGLEPFMDRWLAGPLFSGLSDEQAAKAQRLTNRADGLAASLRNCGTGTQQPLWGRLSELKMPVLLLVGEDDHKFTAIAERMANGITGAPVTVVRLPGTHAVHLEKPEAAAEAILSHIASW